MVRLARKSLWTSGQGAGDAGWAEVHRIAGEIALMSPEPDAAKAEAYLERALAVARRQQAKSWELRAAMSMARLWRDQGKPHRADDETARALFDRMMAYSGRYRLRVDGCFITIVDSAWYPAWIGTEQTNFFTLDGDTLSIISPLLQHPKFPNDRVRGVAIWRKE